MQFPGLEPSGDALSSGDGSAFGVKLDVWRGGDDRVVDDGGRPLDADHRTRRHRRWSWRRRWLRRRLRRRSALSGFGLTRGDLKMLNVKDQL